MRRQNAKYAAKQSARYIAKKSKVVRSMIVSGFRIIAGFFAANDAENKAMELRDSNWLSHKLFSE